MKTGILFLTFFAFIACSNSSSEVIDDKEQPKPGQLGQQVDGSLIADGNSAKTYDLIKRSGYDHEALILRANIKRSISSIFSRYMTIS